MQVSDDLYSFQIAFEGLRLSPYVDSGDVLTIGVGHTNDEYFEFTKDTLITEEQAHNIWLYDIKEAQDIANNALTHDIDQRYFDMYVDLIFNAGMPKTLTKYLNEENYEEAKFEFLRWIYVNKKIVLGLVKRRFAEFAFVCGDDWSAFTPNNCLATSNNLKPLNILIEKYGYKVTKDSNNSLQLELI